MFAVLQNLEGSQVLTVSLPNLTHSRWCDLFLQLLSWTTIAIIETGDYGD